MKRRKSEVPSTTPSTAPSTTEELLLSAANKVGPIAQAAADALEAAAARVGPIAHDAANRIEPLAQNVAVKVGPLAQQAADRVTPYAQQAAGRVTPYAQQVGGYATQVGTTVGPYAVLARQRGAQVAHDVIERWRPALEEAMAKVSPNVEAARDRINEDLLPKLIAALEAAAAAPVVQEATKRGQATLAAAKGELSLPEPAALPAPGKKKGRWVRRVLVVAAVGGVVVVVARKLLSDTDADWQAARPTAPYTPPKPPTPPATASNGQATTESATAPEASVETLDPVELAEAGPVPISADDSVEQEPPEATPAEGAGPGEVDLGVAAEDLVGAPPDVESASADTEEIEESDEIEDGVAPDADRSRYSGEGVYVGEEPPEGFTIKANERSMKYHVPESTGYARTVTVVWFNSEEAAQEAGFLRAQR